ncbi:MAG: ABC transporter ATP-binding protein [Azoarcus sp.]|jgi:NitT/TauT family transport system ATP-binding protein|nr:ABC transporter ATP-binding protein [Azoarcus sp.]
MSALIADPPRADRILDDEFAVSLEGVKKHFKDGDGGVIEVIRDITLGIRKEEFISIVGPSGCGKSTMFNIIAGLLEPSSGRINLHGREDAKRPARIGYMLQTDLLFPWRTIIDNVSLGLEIAGKRKDERYKLAHSYLERYGLGDFANAYPSKLSGGMRQRVALIRTLITDPDVILLDEPFSALDYQTRLVLEEEIVSILREFGKTVVLITHDIGEAISMSDRIAVMSKRPTTVKKLYDVGLARKHGSCLKARSDVEYQGIFDQIWSDLDIQMGAAH